MFANDHCTGKLNYVKLIRESIWFAMIDSWIDSVRNILIRCTPISHGVEDYFHRLWGMGISDAILSVCVER